MTRAEFDALLHRQPSLGDEMVRVLRIRLRESDDAIIRDLQTKNQQLHQAYRELQAARAQLIEKERLGARAQVARVIQESILPRTLPSWRGSTSTRGSRQHARSAATASILSRSAPIRWAS